MTAPDRRYEGGEGIMSLFVNQIRFYHYIAGVLSTQRSDPLCGACKAHENTVSAMKEALAALEREYQEQLRVLPDNIAGLFEQTRNRLSEMTPAGDAIGQKKAGNCKMPEGVCFVKSSKAMRSRLEC
jgi:hypothetical protein